VAGEKESLEKSDRWRKELSTGEETPAMILLAKQDRKLRNNDIFN
jgi:hypothetical protein